MSRPIVLLLASLLLGACARPGFADPSREFGPPVPADAPLHHVDIHVPPALGALDTHLDDVRGRPVGVSCDTCHGPAADGEPMADRAGAPDEPLHADLELAHGDLSCDSCHDPTDRTHLRLADGTLVDYADAMDLCTQCHGPQARDYRGGSHGGMTGYWDLRRGPRSRNHCVDCHAPHDPAYRAALPVFPPRDRYFGSHEERETH